MCDVKVNLGDRSYSITIGENVIDRVGPIADDVVKPTIALIVSTNLISKYYSADLISSFRQRGIRSELVILPAGERYKTLNTVKRIYESLIDYKVDRKGLIVALGGGVIGDMAGFAAATYMRGIDLIQIPTTLLSQVDASVGGKTAVDMPQGKNLIGSFYQPRAVIIDVRTLLTLPVRELKAGLAEVIKHGIIYDHEYFNFIDTHSKEILSRNLDVLVQVIKRSVEIKRDVVQIDERESGIRAILNYGHTVGHAIEMVSGYGKFRHGEALAIGMVSEAILAEQRKIAAEGTSCIVGRVLRSVGLSTDVPESIKTDDIISAIELDKKNLGGNIRTALPTQIGHCEIFAVTRNEIVEAITTHRKINDKTQ